MKAMAVTLNGVSYGNRLQNYAICYFFRRISMEMDIKNLYIEDLRRRVVLKRTTGLFRKIVKSIFPRYLIKLYRRSRWDTLYVEKKYLFDKFTEKYMDSEDITIYHDRDIKKYTDNEKYSFFLPAVTRFGILTLLETITIFSILQSRKNVSHLPQA